MKLFGLNTLRWYARLPIKLALLGLTVLAVCFPYPHRLIRHLQHFRDPNALIEPDAPAIDAWAVELQTTLNHENIEPRDALKHVEKFVYHKIPYQWDWETWGTADYLPTVGEVMEMGVEDCDGRAVVAASLLRRLGYQAHLVNDFAHMWVRTDQGDTMAPGKKPVVIATDDGPQLHLDALLQLPQAAAYGIAVFPWFRELIVLAVLWLLLLPPDGRWVRAAAGLTLLIGGLLALRYGSVNYWHPIVWAQWLGLAALAGGVGTVAFGTSRKRLGTKSLE